MLKETLVILAAIAMFTLVISYFLHKKGGRVILQYLSMALFIGVAIGSLDVQQEYCFFDAADFNNTNCIVNSVFDEQSAYVFSGLALVAAVLGTLSILQQSPLITGEDDLT